jgi:replicative DNA helicase
MKKVPIAAKTEASALSLLATDPEILSTQTWDASLFATMTHQKVFDAIKHTHDQTGCVSPITAIVQLDATGDLQTLGGDDAIYDILRTITLAPGKVCQDMANDYRKHLIKVKGYRDTLNAFDQAEPDIRTGKADLKALGELISTAGDDKTPVTTSTKQRIIKIVDQMEGKVVKECFPTGLVYLDKTMKGGMHHGELLTVASETGGGKSIMLVQAAVANLAVEKSVLFFSLEMDANDILERMACHLAGIPLRTKEEYKEQYSRELPSIFGALNTIQKYPLTVVDDITDIDGIIAECNRVKPDVVIVDYIQIVENIGNDNREQAISETTRKLKNLASRNRCVVFTASQLNDDGQLRESRAIGQHSNSVVFITHEKSGTKIVVKKNRRGPKNYAFSVQMNGEISKFIE